MSCLTFQRILRIAAAAMLVVVAIAANAQEWPTRPVTMVVPFGAGGGVDVTARILAPRLAQILGQQVVVENIGGAGGMTGSARIAKAAPDGYQFVYGNAGTHAINQRSTSIRSIMLRPILRRPAWSRTHSLP